MSDPDGVRSTADVPAVALPDMSLQCLWHRYHGVDPQLLCGSLSALSPSLTLLLLLKKKKKKVLFCVFFFNMA